MDTLSRRAVIQGASAAALAIASPSHAANHPDADLFEALRRWQREAAALKAMEINLAGKEPGADERQEAFDAAVSAFDDLWLETIETPARTIEGFLAKAKAISDGSVFHELGSPEFMEAAGRALLADVEALHGPLPSHWVFPRI